MDTPDDPIETPVSTVPVTLLFADGLAHRLDAAPGQRLMEACSAAGLSLLTDCSNGQCGTCTARLVSGAIDLDDYDAAVLPDDERADGQVLPCVCRVTGACVIEFPYDASEVSGDEPAPISGTVAEVATVADQVVRLVVEVAQPLWFEPGQYVRLHPAGTGVHRPYSMANAPGATRLVFYVRLVDGGAFSQWLAGAAAGDAIEVSVPHGSFFLRDEARPRLFVAGGTGLAPFLSMLQADASPAPTTLIVGARSAAHLFALDECRALRERRPGLDLRIAVEAGAGDDLQAGHPTDLIDTLDLPPETRVYLCGPPPMVDAGRGAVARRGLPVRDVLCERFA